MPQLTEIIKKKNNFQKKDYRAYDLEAKKQNNQSTLPNSNTIQEDINQNHNLNINKEPYKIIEINPSHCKPWIYADRKTLEMGNIEELANSIKANGQQEPALIRKISANVKSEIQYEVVFGHRRWLACSLCDKPLLAMVKNLTDKEAAVAQKEENENRENLSDYARAFNYKTLIDDKIFSSARELAANLNISRTTLSDILSYTKIPTKLQEALITPHLLPKRTAIKLAQLCNNISQKDLQKLCEVAPDILSGNIPYSKINIEIFNYNSKNQKNIKPNIKQFKNNLSVKLFTSGQNQNRAPCFTFHKIIVDNNLLAELEDVVFNFLKNKTESL